MSDHILSAALTFALLAGGTAAIGSDLVGSRSAAAPRATMAAASPPKVTVIGKRDAAPAVATLPRVAVVGKRDVMPAVAALPRVTVVGKRLAPTKLAVESGSSEPVRFE